VTVGDLSRLAGAVVPDLPTVLSTSA